MLEPPKTFLPHGGNYKDLAVYKKATVIYDMTFYFAHRYLQKSDRTIDQMVQAARSGKQNIAEGSSAHATTARAIKSRKTSCATSTSAHPRPSPTLSSR